MFRYSSFLDTLLKAMTHKYIRRVPKGVTKTGKTKYMYFYAGQEGHGQGVAHESELVEGASFAFGEHGKTRYHAHISKVDGDKVTVKYDDGAKKGQEETMTKKQFQALVHGEHASSIKQAKEKAEKQLKDFQAGKEKGVKVKQETLDKLAQRVKNLDELSKPVEAAKKETGNLTKEQKDFRTQAISFFSERSGKYKRDIHSDDRLNAFVTDMKTVLDKAKQANILTNTSLFDGVLSASVFSSLFDDLYFRTFIKDMLKNNPKMLTDRKEQTINLLRDAGNFISKQMKTANTLNDITSTLIDALRRNDTLDNTTKIIQEHIDAVTISKVKSLLNEPLIGEKKAISLAPTMNSLYQIINGFGEAGYQAEHSFFITNDSLISSKINAGSTKIKKPNNITLDNNVGDLKLKADYLPLFDKAKNVHITRLSNDQVSINIDGKVQQAKDVSHEGVGNLFEMSISDDLKQAPSYKIPDSLKQALRTIDPKKHAFVKVISDGDKTTFFLSPDESKINNEDNNKRFYIYNIGEITHALNILKATHGSTL